MKFAAALLLLVPLLITAGCADSSENNTKVFQFVDQPDLARKVFEQSTLACGAGETCPDYVGGMTTFAAKKEMGKAEIIYEVGVCSLTLVAENLVLTNRHCLPEDLQSVGTSCYNRIKIKFPATKTQFKADHNCDRIEALSSPKGGAVAAPDWALLSLTVTSTRDPVVINNNGIDMDQQVYFYPAYYNLIKDAHSVITATGQIRGVTCRTGVHAISNLPFIDKYSALFGTSQCSLEIIRGNSGTGLLSQNYELIGIGSFGLEQGGTKFGGTNLACIPYFNSERAEKCRY